jgi:hypothetical protein
MKYKEVLEKLKQGWWLTKYRGLYGRPPRWQLFNPKAPPEWKQADQKILTYGVVYHQTGEKIVLLENIKEIKHFPALTYAWVEKVNGETK